ncbi:MAG: acireductone synthase [Chitinophagales bacterium]
MIRYILIDTIGTISSNDFMLKVLMPYAKENLADYIYNHIHTTYLWQYLADAKNTITEEEGVEPTNGELIDTLIYWIDTERQHPAIQFLQAEIWKKGYTTGQYHGHIYDDVPNTLKQWNQAGIEVGVYESKPLEAIKMMFHHTRYGNLDPYLSDYFDQDVGEKYHVYTYQKMERALDIPAKEILFLSSSELALNTAKAAGLKTLQLQRTGVTPTYKHHRIRNISQIKMKNSLFNVH